MFSTNRLLHISFTLRLNRTEFTQPATKRNKDKKKKGSRTSSALPAPTVEWSKEDVESTGVAGKVLEIQPEASGSDNNGVRFLF